MPDQVTIIITCIYQSFTDDKVGQNDLHMLEDADYKDSEAHHHTDAEPTTSIHKLSKINTEISNLSPANSLKSAGAVTLHFQQNLNHLYINLKSNLRKHKKRELSFATPEPVTFKMIERLHDELFEHLTELEINTEQCYRALGVSNNRGALLAYINKLKNSKDTIEKQLKDSEEQRNKYCDHITKLDLKIRNQASEIQIKEQKLKKLTEEKVNKEDQELKLKNKVDEFEKQIMRREAIEEKLEEALRNFESDQIRLEQENATLKRQLKERHTNHYNRNFKDNLRGILNASNQSKGSQILKSQEDKSTDSQRTSLNTKPSVNRHDKLKQARIHRRQTRYQDYSQISCLTGSQIFNTNTETEETRHIRETQENISEIEQMKLSLNNTRNSHVETPPSSPRLLESHKCSPSKIIAVHIQRRTVGPDHKDSPSEPDPFLNRKGYKRPPLLKALTSKNEEKENGIKPKRKGFVDKH